MEIKKIFIVPYCHADWAWTSTRNWHIKRYLLVFKEVIDIIKEKPEFRWYMDTYITEFEPFLKKEKLLLNQLKKFVKDGKIEICGSFTNLRTSMVGEETQIRDLIIGREKYKNAFPFAKLDVYAGTVDVSVGHPQIPQILKKAGYKYLRFWRPHGALSKENVPLEFYWVGLDGSEILTSRGSYSGFNYYENLEENFKKEVEYYLKDSKTKIIWISIGMDDSRPLKTPYSDIDIPIFDFIKKMKGKIEIKFATPKEYFKEIEKQKLEKLKMSLDPCEVSYNVGWGGNNGLFSLRQENEINLTESEKISSLSSIFKSEYPNDFKKLWEQHLLTCAHATSWLFEDDFNEIYQIAEYVKLKTKEIKKEKLKFLTEKFFDKNGDICIFNTLPFEREEYVKLTLSSPTGFGENFEIFDGKGEKIEYQIIDKNEKDGKTFEYFVCGKISLPPLGFNSVYLKEGKKKEKIYKEKTKITFDNSDIVKINFEDIELKAEKENSFADIKFYKVDTKKGSLHIGPIEKIEKVKWRKNKILKDGNLYRKYKSEGKVGEIDIKRNIYVFKNEGRIDFEIEVDWGNLDGFLTFEVPVVFNGKIYGGIPFGVEEKDIENRYYSENIKETDLQNIERQRKNLFYARSFINFTDNKKSISYVNYDATHYYILFKKSIGNILLNSVTYRPGWERFLNKEIKAEGKHKFFSTIFVHKGNWKTLHLPQKAMSVIRTPEVVYTSRLSSDGNKKYLSFLRLKPENLLLTSFYKENNFYILRFFESEGKRTMCQLSLPFKPEIIEKTDLIGNKISKLPSRNEIEIDIKAWEIVTLRIKNSQEP